jgi:hypothetical protein
MVIAVLAGLAVLTAAPASAQDCYASAITSPSPFMGNNDEVFRLRDGSVWQVKYEYEYMYAYSPSVTICPGQGKMIIGRKTLNVQAMSAPPGARQRPAERSAATTDWVIFEETQLQGSISGTVRQGTDFRTTSGNIYEVTGITLQLVLELQPDALVLRNGDTYRLIVDGFDEPLICRRLNARPTPPADSVSPRAPAAPALIESQIDGEFTGWEGETIFALRNGQIWQQASYAYKYHYAYAPKVLIYRAGSGYRMRVDKVDGEISVIRLK